MLAETVRDQESYQAAASIRTYVEELYSVC